MKIITANKQYPGSLLDVSPEDLASQICLMDLQIFKSIRRDELINLGESCGLTNRNTAKRRMIPNVVAMNRQFNQISFWVVGQILHHNSPRSRAEWICHFIKTARKLHQLNNLHSAYAFVSAMLSTPIYRLEKTWHQVRKRHFKEKAQFDSLQEFYSDESNYYKLRKHLLACPLPCIPYLGIYSRDIIYLNEAYPEASEQRINAVGRIIDSLERFQQSTYDHLVSIQELEQSLKSCRYIDELQKFVEDESYRRSLELEPGERPSLSETKCASAQKEHGARHQSLDLTTVNQLNKPTSDSSNGTMLDQNGNTAESTSAKQYKNSALLLVWSLTAIFQSSSNKSSSQSSATDTSHANKQQQRKNTYLVDDSYVQEPISIKAGNQASSAGAN